MTKAKIKEIFASIQGEGRYVGYKQLFIRFCGCNLKCSYCDTDFSLEKDYTEYSPEMLAGIANDCNDIHSVSLTGGEPLLQADFLKEFLPLTDKTIYLETNATLSNNFIMVKPFIDIISADIKLESSTGIKNTFEMHEKFFEACRGVETFAKIVFNKNITSEEIIKCCELGRKYDIELILQPEMNGKFMTVDSASVYEILNKFLKEYKQVRLIPQVHKYLDVR